VAGRHSKFRSCLLFHIELRARSLILRLGMMFPAPLHNWLDYDFGPRVALLINSGIGNVERLALNHVRLQKKNNAVKPSLHHVIAYYAPTDVEPQRPP